MPYNFVIEPRPKSLFFGVMGAPYESDMVTTLFRMVAEAVEQNNRVTVWTCGSATSLSLQSIGIQKPRNYSCLNLSYPSVSAMAQGLIMKSEGLLEWLICRHCMDERGTQNQIAEVKIKPPFKYMDYYNHADIALIIGAK